MAGKLAAQKRVTLASLRKKRGYTNAQLAAECRKHQGGEKISHTHVCGYLTGSKACGDAHFLILCRVLRVAPEDVYTVRFLASWKGSDSES